VFNEQVITEFFTQYAYNAPLVYAAVIIIMTLSSFGLPIPEEFTLVTAGFVAYMGMNPSEFPPPASGGSPVNVYTLCFVAFVAVLGSDFLIYSLGRFWEDKIRKTRLFKKIFTEQRYEQVKKFYDKYGAYSCGFFRFMPGIRFPGHMSCGFMNVPIRKFLLIDGAAALLSVPTQVYFVATYGKEILENFKTFKFVIFGVIAVVILYMVIKHKLKKRKYNL
jgi:membrane protein DedA with SNARE-associated domain